MPLFGMAEALLIRILRLWPENSAGNVAGRGGAAGDVARLSGGGVRVAAHRLRDHGVLAEETNIGESDGCGLEPNPGDAAEVQDQVHVFDPPGRALGQVAFDLERQVGARV